MAVMYMQTRAYEKTQNMVPWSTKIPINPEQPGCQLIDSRLRLMMPLSTFNAMLPLEVYFNYVKTYCELVNEKPTSIPAQYAACGFLPVGVEPECLCNFVNKNILLPSLRNHGIEYFLIHPSSPVWSSYKPIAEMASNHDIWVNKMEAAKLVHKPIHNITTLDLLEVLIA